MNLLLLLFDYFIDALNGLLQTLLPTPGPRHAQVHAERFSILCEGSTALWGTCATSCGYAKKKLIPKTEIEKEIVGEAALGG